jgi:hypothetical protein
MPDSRAVDLIKSVHTLLIFSATAPPVEPETSGQTTGMRSLPGELGADVGFA